MVMSSFSPSKRGFGEGGAGALGVDFETMEEGLEKKRK